MKPQLTIVIAGPTASGKSALAVAVAERTGGTIINADSMQLYQALEIVTDRPRGDVLARIPHRLYGALGLRDRCTAGAWRDMALQEIRACRAENRTPVLVGGSGLYLRALTHGFHPLPQVPPDIRTGLKRRLHGEGATKLHAELSARDPASAARIESNDGQRIVRALEILEHTGQGLAYWYELNARATADECEFFNVLAMPPRAVLHAASDQRFLAMLREGAINEVERFRRMKPDKDCPLWKAHGVLPICDLLDGKASEAQMIETTQRDIRRYAKRQITWFRHQMTADLVCDTPRTERSAELICSRIAELR